MQKKDGEVSLQQLVNMADVILGRALTRAICSNKRALALTLH